jgi:hypothetical protein
MVIYQNGKSDNYQSANHASDASRLLHPWAWKVYFAMKDADKWEMHQFLVKTFIDILYLLGFRFSILFLLYIYIKIDKSCILEALLALEFSIKIFVDIDITTYLYFEFTQWHGLIHEDIQFYFYFTPSNLESTSLAK